MLIDNGAIFESTTIKIQLKSTKKHTSHSNLTLATMVTD